MEKFLSYFESYETIIWDWNGTLLNDVEISHEIVAEQRKDHGLPLWTAESIQKKFCFPVKNFYQRMGFDVTGESFGKLAKFYIESYENRLHEMELFQKTHEILQELSHKKQFVLSAAEENHLNQQVKLHGIRDHFLGVYGLEGSHGGCKKKRAKQLIEDFNLNEEKTLLVGDTTHDAEVADFIGAQSLLIADGFHHYQMLKNQETEVLESRFQLLG